MPKMNREVFKNILDKYYASKPPTKFCLVVDFDGTLCDSHYPDCGEPTAVWRFLQDIADLDFNLVISTCRTGKANTDAYDWCFDKNIFCDYWNENATDRIDEYGDCRKIAGDMVIDNNSYNFNMEDFE